MERCVPKSLPDNSEPCTVVLRGITSLYSCPIYSFHCVKRSQKQGVSSGELGTIKEAGEFLRVPTQMQTWCDIREERLCNCPQLLKGRHKMRCYLNRSPLTVRVLMWCSLRRRHVLSSHSSFLSLYYISSSQRSIYPFRYIYLLWILSLLSPM